HFCCSGVRAFAPGSDAKPKTYNSTKTAMRANRVGIITGRLPEPDAVRQHGLDACTASAVRPRLAGGQQNATDERTIPMRFTVALEWQVHSPCHRELVHLRDDFARTPSAR